MSFTFFIFEKKMSYWKSCEIFQESYLKIVDNVLQQKKGEKIFVNEEVYPQDYLTKLKLKIKEGNRVNLFATSHLIQPYQLVNGLEEYEKEKVQIILPVFGDITVEPQRWMTMGQELINVKIMLLYASTSYEHLLKASVLGGSYEYSPYPVSNLFFENLITQNDFHNTIQLTYAGRVTPAKGICEILDLARFIKKNKLNFKINIVGNFFERGRHLHSYILNFEEFKKRFVKDLEEVYPVVQYIPEVSQNELREIFLHTDHYICFGTYHDEDFGLSPAQAMSTGCGIFLTEWGGFRTFSPPCGSEKVSVVFDENYIPVAHSGDIIKKLLKLKKLSSEDRLQNQAYAKKLFSEEVVVKIWSELLEKEATPFKGMSEDYKMYYHLYFNESRFPFRKLNERPASLQLYKNLYGKFFN